MALILKLTYVEINDLIRGEGAGVVVVCSLPYVKGNGESRPAEGTSGSYTRTFGDITRLMMPNYILSIFVPNGIDSVGIFVQKQSIYHTQNSALVY